MGPSRQGLVALVWAGLLLLVPATSDAAVFEFNFTAPGTFPFSGNFSVDNDVALVHVLISNPGELTAETNSYAAGGLDPYLALFDPSGMRIAENDDRDDSTFDAFLTAPVLPGLYTLALTQYPNFSHDTLAGGFDLDDQMFFTKASFGTEETECDAFVDFNGSCRTSAYAGSISVVNTASVPEPAMLTLVGIGLAGAARRRRGARDRTSAG